MNVKLLGGLGFLLFVFAMFQIDGGATNEEGSFSMVDKGRQVYVAEGCVHCHSQYVRPLELDTERWGEATPLPLPREEAKLIGNRRQGPDLAQVGSRRSQEWNRAHLIDPQGVSLGSRMPSYRHLFEGERKAQGEALLAYLDSLVGKAPDHWLDRVFSWSPRLAGTSESGSPELGRSLYAANCSQCHGEEGRGGGSAAGSFSVAPRNLRDEEWRFVSRSLENEYQAASLARVIKYGVLGTSMPGHEYLTDVEIAALVDYLAALKGVNLVYENTDR